MSLNAVVASGPIEFFDGNRQYFVPLSALYFDNGAIKADHWGVYIQSGFAKAALDSWLAYLVAQRLVSPAASPAAVPAFTIEAVDAGGMGNFITIDFEHIDATNLTADVTVTATETYTLLTPTTIGSVIGTVAGGGTRPGLVFAVLGSSPTMPTATSGTALDPKTGTLDIGGAITLQAKGSSTNPTTITIKDVDATATTFTLIATWSLSVPKVDLKTLNTTFGYVITVTPASPTLAPAAGSITLAGGTDAASAIKSKATVLASV